MQPRASRNRVNDYRDGALRVSVTAPPHGGRANTALLELLADVLGVAKSRLTIIRGHSSRDKIVAVEGLAAEDINRLLDQQPYLQRCNHLTGRTSMAIRYMNFGWVLENELAGSQGPVNLQDLFFLYQQGVRAVIRMEERTIPADTGGYVDIVDMYVPVRDFTPPDQEQIDRMIEFIDEQVVQNQRPVVVSCYAGIGRTGTVLACYLVRRGAPPAEAIDEVRRLRPRSVQTPEQEAAVYEYARRQGTGGDSAE